MAVPYAIELGETENYLFVGVQSRRQSPLPEELREQVLGKLGEGVVSRATWSHSPLATVREGCQSPYSELGITHEALRDLSTNAQEIAERMARTIAAAGHLVGIDTQVKPLGSGNLLFQAH